MKPFVELSFMPTALASGDKTVFHYHGNVTPPQDYKKWAQLIGKLIAHWIERYGKEEVRQWFFEVWNEPNLEVFWTGTQKDYFKLYRHTVEAIKAADKRLKVGGPATAMNAWIGDFLEFCAKNHLPADFVSTHHYPTDAFGRPGDDTEAQLAASHRGVLREQARATRRQAGQKPLYYSEWCTSSNPRYYRHDDPYAAAFVTKTILEATGLVQGYSYWTFSDIFEENYFPSLPFHGGFGLLNIHGVAKPVYRAFELLHQLGDELLPVKGAHQTVDAWAVRDANGVTILFTNHALPRQAIRSERVQFTLSNTASPRAATMQRIDENHANAKRVWQALGAPEYLSPGVVEKLHAASRLRRRSQQWHYQQGVTEINLRLPPHAVASVRLAFSPRHND
jgi:xylan 1,4-beta-xylosidase